MIRRIWRRLFRDPEADNFIGFDKYRKRGAYHWQEITENPDYRALIETVARYVGSRATVLDIGCGDGAYLGVVAGQVKEAWGIDADAVAIRLASEKLRGAGIVNCKLLNLRLDQAKKHFRLVDTQFDVVWSTDVIEHLPRPAELLEFASQVVAPTGRCLIGTPLFISDALVSPYHVKEYTRSEIRTLIDAHLAVEEEIILPHQRKDGRTYREGYYLAVARPFRSAEAADAGRGLAASVRGR